MPLLKTQPTGYCPRCRTAAVWIGSATGLCWWCEHEKPNFPRREVVNSKEKTK